jgi:uncharacterized protein GlcG (DUF336 family)
MKKSTAAVLCAAGFVFVNPLPGLAQDVLTTHRLSAVLAAEAVTEAVAACAKQGYKVTATIVDTDGVTQAMLRGDGASMTTLGAARDKAYTVFMLGAPRNEDTRWRNRAAHGSYIIRRRFGEVTAHSTVAGRDQN